MEKGSLFHFPYLDAATIFTCKLLQNGSSWHCINVFIFQNFLIWVYTLFLLCCRQCRSFTFIKMGCFWKPFQPEIKKGLLRPFVNTQLHLLQIFNLVWLWFQTLLLCVHALAIPNFFCLLLCLHDNFRLYHNTNSFLFVGEKFLVMNN